MAGQGSPATSLESLRGLPVPVKELLAGGVAGATAKSAIAPLERCKILFQTGKLRNASLGHTLSHIYRSEGLPGLFRGNGASVLRIVPYAAVHYWAYEHYRRQLVAAGALGAQEHSVPPVLDMLAGAAAGGSAVLVTYPLDLVRTRLAYSSEAGAAAATACLQAASPAAAAAGRSGGLGRLKGRGLPGARALHLLRLPARAAEHTIHGVLAGTFKQEGLRGLYHGVGASMYGILPYAGLKFFTYQHLKQVGPSLGGVDLGGLIVDVGPQSAWYHHANPHALSRTGVDGRPRLPVPVMLAFGGVAGLVAQTVTYPLDVVRRQMQVEGLKLREAAASSPARQLSAGATQQLSLRSTPQALVLLARQHGWRCLYAGLHINYIKVVPATALGFTLYDYMKSALALPTNL
ncbi:hypothetical protein ABPG77_010310 [Micractinium sp. CCAP 211/92]